MTWQEKILEKIKIIKCLKRERGSILVLTAVLLPILFGCLGIAYDVGNIYIHKARLQNVTDAAALAGGRAYLQSQKKTTGTKDTYDNYTNGNITDEEYVIGGSKTRSGYHPDADNAADVYIYNNIINLGNKVYSDKFSHYALPGHKKIGEDYVNADEIFYRIGLYEKVPLYFLPVITNKNVETVRAGSVVVVVPEKTEVREWDEYIPGTGGTPAATSLFDKLFVVKNQITFDGDIVSNPDDNALGITALSNITATFVGDVVYTGATWDTSKYISQEDDGFYLFSQQEAGYQAGEMSIKQFRRIPNTGSRMVMDNSIDIEYYVKGFKEKLKRPHIDLEFNSQDTIYTASISSFPRKSEADVYVNSVKSGTYYHLNDDGSYSECDYNPCAHATITVSDEKYVKGSDNIYTTIKTDKGGGFGEDLTHEPWYVSYTFNRYVVDSNGREHFIYDNNGNRVFYRYKNTGSYWAKDSYDLITDYNTTETNDKITYSYVENGNTVTLEIKKINGTFSKYVSETNNDEVYHWDRKGSGENIRINGGLDGNETDPIYIIVEEGKCDFEATVTNQRPVIFCYLGTQQLTVTIGSDCTFSGLIYAPYVETLIKNNNNFIGNVISKQIKVDRMTGAIVNFTQKNFVTSDGDLNITPDTAAAAQEARKQQAISYAKQALVSLGVDDAAWNDKDWLSKEENAGKVEAIREAWYNARLTLWQDTGLDMPDWPWSTGGKTTDLDRHHYSVETGSGSTPAQTIHHTETVVLTDAKLRLINYRTEYQSKDDMEDGYVLDPYIYETLGKPNSY